MYKVIYTVFSGDQEKGEGLSFSTSNMRVLAKQLHLGYDNLVRIFSREKRKFWSIDKFIIIKSVDFIKGAPRVPGVKFWNGRHNRNI